MECHGGELPKWVIYPSGKLSRSELSSGKIVLWAVV